MTQEQINNAISSKESKILMLKGMLSETDYVVIRAKEQGTNLTADFKNQRQGWRDDINALEAEIAELQALEPEEEVTEEV
ncbi:MAG: hypothetical protein K6G25_06615 [Bacteroidales bacterium]|nr:hypothetical protein [Bacteroidales bacterium]